MNDQEATRLLDRLAHQIPIGPAPVQHLIRAGHSAERRRRRTALAGVVVAVIVLLAGVVVQQSLRTGNHTIGPSVEVPSLPKAPDGTRLVGLGQVVVAVPRGWATNDVECGLPAGDTVYFSSSSNGRCLLNSTPVSSLVMADINSRAGHAAMKAANETSTVNGVHLLESALVCDTSVPGICSQNFGVPSEGVVFEVTSPTPDVIDSIRGSLLLLPAGYTAVPFDPNAPLQHTLELMHDAGLHVRVVHTYRKNLGSGVLLGSNPPVGSVVATGGSVTLTVSSPSRIRPNPAPDAADIRGLWSVKIAGIRGPGGRELVKTYDQFAMTMDFTANRWRASDGCVDYTGTFTLSKGIFRSSEPTITTHGCPHPAGGRPPIGQLMTTARHAQIAGGQLQLLASTYRIIVVFLPLSPHS
jgi:hypothetical protein